MRAMPTIVQINSCANWGSTGRIAEQINLKASSHGWNTFIAYGGSMNPSQSKLIRIGSRFSKLEAILEARLFDNSGMAARNATKKLVKQLIDIKPDIIHLHNLHAYYLNYKLLFDYLNSTNIPIVWTLHDCWAFTGHCSHFASVNCEKWITGCYDCPLKKEYPASWIIDASRRNYALKKECFSQNKNIHIVAVSEWIQDLIKKSFLQHADKRVINNGVDLSVFKPTKDKNKGLFRIIGVSSIWIDQKLQGFKELSGRLDPKHYEIVLVGLNSKQIKDLPVNILGVPRTNSIQELAGLYSSADVFVNLTYNDTFPTTNLEALACGTPVVTYRTGGSTESVSSETGFVVEQGDIEGVVQSISIVKEMGKERFTNNCRKRAIDLYNKEDRFEDYIKLYESLI